MYHPESVTAVITANEPPNGSKLIVDKGDGDWTVIWRADEEADRWYDGDPRGQHWFDDEDQDPMALHQHIQYADAVYALGEPLAVFNR
jgi:predicted lipoprotein with Yx(FWY)xxD motif